MYWMSTTTIHCVSVDAHVRQLRPRHLRSSWDVCLPPILQGKLMNRAAICTAACLLLCACSGAAAGRSEQEDSLSNSELQAEVILIVATAFCYRSSPNWLLQVVRLRSLLQQSTSSPCPSLEVPNMSLACPASSSTAHEQLDASGGHACHFAHAAWPEHAALLPCKASALVTVDVMHPEAVALRFCTCLAERGPESCPEHT